MPAIYITFFSPHRSRIVHSNFYVGGYALKARNNMDLTFSSFWTSFGADLGPKTELYQKRDHKWGTK